jgi:pyrroline-5-carboxylate reductase
MTLQIDGTVLLAGVGNMGSAMLAGWLEEGLAPAQIIVQDPAPPAGAKELLARHSLEAVSSIASLPQPPSVIVVAVKPQVMDAVFAPLAKLASKATVVLSIAAGRTIAGFAKHLPQGSAVVRAMPNTPAAIRRGITVGVANAHVTPAQRTTCDALLRAVGEVAWVEDENLIDAVTAVSGSGPAYVFYLTECLAEAATTVGLGPELGRKLARATVAGSGELLDRSDLGADVLRQNVTSQGGTTFAALQVLMAQQGGLPDLMREAVAAAARRSRELAK